MISYGKQTIDNYDIESLVKVLKSEWLTQGPYIEKFESKLKKYFDSKFASVLSSGTAGLHLAGLALGWGKGDIVITTPITFLATANCVLYSGADIDFVDIDAKSYTIDLNKLENKIKSYKKEGKNIKAVIGVDFAGYPCNWEELKFLSNKYNFNLINDNCHAIGARYHDKSNYAVKFADLVIQSYHPVKHITTGEGGAILTNNEKFDKKIKLLRTHGITKKGNNLNKKQIPWYYEMTELGFNYRITDLQCALGISQLKKLDKFLKKRKKIASIYDRELDSNKFIVLPYVSNNIDHAYHLYPIQIKLSEIKKDKISIFEYFKKRGINLQVHYIPIHMQPYYQKMFNFKKGDFPVSEKFYFQEISLPIYPSLSIKDVNYIIKTINSIIK